MFCYLLGLSLLTGIVFGLAPAIKASKADVATTLNAGGRSGSASWTRGSLADMLVISEVALRAYYARGSRAIHSKLQNAQKTDVGFESKRLLMAFDLDLPLHYDEIHGQQFFITRAARSRFPHGAGGGSGLEPPLRRWASSDGVSGRKGRDLWVSRYADADLDDLSTPDISTRCRFHRRKVSCSTSSTRRTQRPSL